MTDRAETLARVAADYRIMAKYYQAYYEDPRFPTQEAAFGTSAIRFIEEVSERLKHFDHPEWVAALSEVLFKRWYIGVYGSVAFEETFGENDLLRYFSPESEEVWRYSLRVASQAQEEPELYDEDSEQFIAAMELTDDVQDVFAVLKGDGVLTSDWAFDEEVQLTTYLMTIAHDYVDLADALIEHGCGTRNDWDLIVETLEDVSAEGFLGWLGNSLGATEAIFQRFMGQTIDRASRLSIARHGISLVCPAPE